MDLSGLQPTASNPKVRAARLRPKHFQVETITVGTGTAATTIDTRGWPRTYLVAMATMTGQDFCPAGLKKGADWPDGPTNHTGLPPAARAMAQLHGAECAALAASDVVVRLARFLKPGVPEQRLQRLRIGVMGFLVSAMYDGVVPSLFTTPSSPEMTAYTAACGAVKGFATRALQCVLDIAAGGGVADEDAPYKHLGCECAARVRGGAAPPSGSPVSCWVVPCGRSCAFWPCHLR